MNCGNKVVEVLCCGQLSSYWEAHMGLQISICNS